MLLQTLLLPLLSVATEPDVINEQAAIMADKFPGANVAVVMPSRLEACFACFDHFCGRLTASGEPLGYHGQVGKGCPECLVAGNLDSPRCLQAAWPRHWPTPCRASDACAMKFQWCHSQEYQAASQLTSLLQDGGLWAPPPPRPPVPAFNAPAVTPGGDPQGTTGSGGLPPPRLPVRLVGFSKGGIVLNQVSGAGVAVCASVAAWTIPSPEPLDISNADHVSNNSRVGYLMLNSLVLSSRLGRLLLFRCWQSLQPLQRPRAAVAAGGS